ncbi:hypothetical protein J27TS7_11020 [Paenibacillus dendritiformis]|uniref:hypothetical protein n=1 Tax=Paenibacillus dendritiformis TaxID=130049 RepID=UPI001B235948|nr:hypothetical protein [Paenibacillus dendritiformis]GIO71588.1 hypothetical protein J27TS7_11020 [Paenibacillus dendritiformis]
MAEKEFYRLDLVIGTDGVEDAEKQVKAIDKMLEQTTRRASVLGKTKITPTARLEDRLSSPAQKIEGRMEKINRTVARPEARLSDKVSGAANKVSSTLTSLARKPYTVFIYARDFASATIHKIMNVLSSPLTLLGVGGGMAGVTTVGLNMVMEEQGIRSAFKVLLGSEDAAQKRVEELTTFAGQTPYKREEIYEASRILQVFTGNALSTGNELKRIGDIAAGTKQPFGDVALWMGRLYDAMKSGRPVGEMTSRLQEMGAINGEARAGIEALAESGMDISKTWPIVTQAFDKFDGMMEEMSGNLQNLLLGTKSFFTQNVFKRWGMGIESVLGPALKKFRQWRSENKETVVLIGQTFEDLGKKAADFAIGGIEKISSKISELAKNPDFQNADFFGKIKIAWDDLIAKPFSDWWSSDGKAMIADISGKIGGALGGGLKGILMGALGLFTTENTLNDDGTFTSAGVAAGQAFFQSFVDAFDASEIAQKAVEAFQNIQPTWLGGESSGWIGNVLALGFDAWLLTKAYKLFKKPFTSGKKAWNWGKGLFGKGSKVSPGVGGGGYVNPAGSSKKPLQRAPGPYQRGWYPRTPTTHPPVAPKSPAVPVKLPPFAKTMVKGLPYVAAGLSVYDIATAEPGQERAKAVGSNAGGWLGAIAGMKLGAAAGSIVPGYGNVVGGLIGMGFGAMGGSRIGEYVMENPEVPRKVAPILGGVSGTGSGTAAAIKAIMEQEKQKKSSETVKISEQQVDQMMSFLKDFKKEVNNDFGINLAPGAIQINMPKEEVDYDLIKNVVGQGIARAIETTLQNTK